MSIKTYVLDTNIIMRNPEVLNGFADNEVVIPEIVLRELDHLKEVPGQTGYEARQAANALDVFYSRKDGNPKDGWTTEGGGILRIEMNEGIEYIPEMWVDEIDKADNRIIGVALMVARMNGADRPTRLVSGDKIMRQLAKNAVYMDSDETRDPKGFLKVESYRNDEVKDFNLSYKGWSIVQVDSPDIINSIYKDGSYPCDDLPDINLEENEFVILQAGKQSALAIYKEGVLHRISCYENGQVYGLVPKNARQKFQLNACVASAEELPCVIVKGSAGTGKTIVTEAAALDALFDGKYDKIIITRSMVNPDNEVELGTLPGEIAQKMDPYLKPFYDNLVQLMRCHGESELDQIYMQIDDLFAQGKIEIQPMSSIRGRSFTRCYIIIDEAQNTSAKQIETLITRLGVGSKIVILGDPDQIDTSRLSRYSNGLAVVSDRMKGSKLTAQIEYLQSDVLRSPLAKEAVERFGQR